MPLAQPVEGLSSRANAEVARLQHRRPDIDVRQALAGYRRTARQPRRWLDFGDHYGLADDLCEQRDMLEAAIRMLPGPAKGELQRLVAPLDEMFLRRTVPDPCLGQAGGWHAEAWWRRRIAV
ncbi:hypothetical protein Acy02nite_74360 [Actinoplanes cyaneus]|uniref:Uncharacterized protein n=1 Tax=Actinoplanes cyaneus TaxID=52696 RepID=A0A919INY1_9ACTN|nr:hypothetical protein [Actinoplanes cyaneus]MCW2143010.1 hypothetical protein [Actinoplanes cyaneus]GID69555.1 hypothetical protein Acy02nite_74360 [Actinoplanes cyaneus]